MNQDIPQRNERSIWSLYIFFSLSRITVPNQPNMVIRISVNPTSSSVLLPPFSSVAPPNISVNRPMEAMIGQ